MSASFAITRRFDSTALLERALAEGVRLTATFALQHAAWRRPSRGARRHSRRVKAAERRASR
jgi:hypothetical protein